MTPIDGRQLLASALHEVRTPIQTIIGTIELLSETNLSTEQSEYVRQIEFSANVLLNLANDVLDYSKITSKEFKIENIPYDVASLTEKTVDLVSIEAFNKGLEIITTIEPDVPSQVRGDPTSVQRVLVNFLKNAVKFTEKGYVRTKLSVRQNKLLFEVIDSGIGVEEDKKTLIFNDYYQADSGTTRKFSGTGLGLAICKNQVQAMHGTLGVRDNDDINGGSVFWFSLPLDVPPLEANAKSIMPKMAIPEDTRILIVDDSDLALASAKKSLNSLGIKDVDTALNAESALKKLTLAAKKSKPYTIAFIDMIMSGMDGWQLASEINNNPQISDMYLYLLVPEGQMGKDAQMKVLDWFNGYIYKPIKRAQIVEALEKAFTKQNIELEPLEGTAHEVTQSPEQNAQIAAGSRILIAEDHPMNRQLLHTFLAKFGAEVIDAEDGQQAVNAIKKDPAIDIIFMDIQMPVKNGIDATIEIREMDYKGIIIACTANNSPEDFEDYRRMGVNDILVKPFKKDAVYALLEKWQIVLSFPAIKSIVTVEQDNKDSKEIWDTEDFEDTAGNDPELAKNLIDEFLIQTQSILDQLKQELQKKELDSETINRLSHTLKGSSATISAHQLSQTAKVMNDAAKEQDIYTVEKSLTEFKSNFTNFKRMVTKWKKTLYTE